MTETLAQPPAAPPAIHEATLASGPSGAVERGAVLDFDTAVARRQQGRNIVVCGDDVRANRRLAEAIESAVGPCRRQDPHLKSAGPHALPHYQQEAGDPPPPEGHSFYETERRKARKQP